MNPKYAWLLLVAAAMAYALWSVSRDPPITAADNRYGDRPGAATLDQRIALLEERFYALESRLAGDNDSTGEVLTDLDTRVDNLEREYAQQGTTHDPSLAFDPESTRTELAYTEGAEASAAIDEPVHIAFENDNIPEPALQVELENADYLFDSQKISDLAFREMDCRERYCRLDYEDHSEDSAAASLAENELFLLLTEKYGGNITVHAGQRNGYYRSLYIELESR